MKANLGMAERVIRIAFALVVAVLYATNVIGGTLAIILGVVAAIFLVTGMISFCPLWRALGISSLRKTANK